MTGDQTSDELAAAAGLERVEVQHLLNDFHAANLVYQPDRGHYRLTSNGEHAIGMLFWAALQVRRPLPAILNQGGWFDA
jgi:DNA-binding IclR family transcriptional regulator